MAEPIISEYCSWSGQGDQRYGYCCKRRRTANHFPIRKDEDPEPLLTKSDARKLMQLLDFQPVSWIWDDNEKKKKFSTNTRASCNSVLSTVPLVAAKDRISRMPLDILLTILSRLPVREAARTSALSRRWRCLWTLCPATLDFDASRAVRELRLCKDRDSILPLEQRKFVNSVNQTLKQHRSRTLDELKVCFDVEAYTCDIDSWIKFAMEKRVRRFRLDLTSCSGTYHGRYTFPSESLASSSFRSLTALHLIRVEVTAIVIDHFLSHSPSLEVLYVERSSCLGTLKVSGPSLKLNYLALINNEVESIEISAVSLVSFKYIGGCKSMRLKNVPHLTEVVLGGCYCVDVIGRWLSDFSSCLSRLEKLMLGTMFAFRQPQLQWVGSAVPSFSSLSNLKEMLLTFDATDRGQTMYSLSIIEASPSLHRLSLRLAWCEVDFERELPSLYMSRPKHQCLKVVEILGFTGKTFDVKLVLYFIERAVSLEKIIIGIRKMTNLEKLDAARGCAREMESLLPARVRLEIL